MNLEIQDKYIPPGPVYAATYHLDGKAFLSSPAFVYLEKTVGMTNNEASEYLIALIKDYESRSIVRG